MKKYLLSFSFLFSILFGGDFVFANTQTYYIFQGNLVNCPSSCGANSYYNGGAGQPGFTWNDVLLAGSTVTAVSIQFGLGVECAAGSHGTYLNGAYQTTIGTSSWCSCSGSGNPVFTVAGAPGNYTRGGANTFLMDYGSSMGLCSDPLGGYYAIITVTYTPPAVPYQAQFISMNTGSATWCAGETRNVTVTVKNSGVSTWTDVAPDVNIGCTWSSNGTYPYRVNAGGLAPGATATYTLTVTAPGASADFLVFDVVKEADCWFQWNSGSCGPGNTAYTSAAQTISCCTPSNPASVAGTATGQTTANLSWAAGATAGSPTVTYSWYVGTNAAGSCPVVGNVPFGFTGGLQSWVVPASVTSINIDAKGAQGGYGGPSTGNGAGGLGASITSTNIAVTPGHTIYIIVGGQGATGSTYGGGGGGGTFVWNATSGTLLTVAGGGGGYGYSSNPTPADGQTNTGTLNATVDAAGAAAGGTGGNGGAGGTNGSWVGAGGAGWFSNGNAGSGNTGVGGSSPGNGGWGGAAGPTYGATGGYGGGGGSDVSGGGGGGYNGGGGGGVTMYSGGSGGGSYVISGTPTTSTNSGNGAVTITYNINTALASGTTTGTTASVTGLTCGTTYYLSVYATSSCNGGSSACTTSPAFVSGACCTAPSISVQPASQTKCVATSVTFSVTAAGTGLTYQWRKGGTNIGGATSSTYTIPSVVVGDAANYDVVITGTCGNITSSAATLTINTASALGTVSNAGPIDFCSAGGDWTAAGPISVSGYNGTVNWQWGSSNGTWNAWVSGASPTYNTFPSKVAASDANADRIRWSVTNGVCAASANSSTILIQNHYNTAPTSLTANAGIVCVGSSVTLTANFASSIDILGTVEFATTCGGAPFATVTAGNNVTSVTATVTPTLGSNQYYARYNPGTGTSCSASACANVNVVANSAPSNANNTSTQTICSNSSATLSGNNPAIGTGVWSVASGPSTSSAQFANTAVYNTTFTPAGGAGSYVVRWSVNNNPCTSSFADATITVNAAPTTSNAGTNQNVCMSTGSATLAANNPAVGTGAWNVVSGPSTSNAQFASTSVYNTVFTPAGGVGNYVLRWTITSTAPCATSTSTVSITFNSASVLGTVSNAGPIDFCSATGDWSSDPISVSGNTGTVWWQYGSSNGTWSADWVSGSQPGYVTFPKKVAASDANPDRVRWHVTSGACASTAYSSAILLRNHYNEDPGSLSSSVPAACATAAVTATLTATFPTATNILGTVEFSTSCGGAPFATVAGNGTTTVKTTFTTPSSSTTYFARYNPGTGTGCSASACVNTLVTADAVPVLGSVSNVGPIDFCSAAGDWSTDPISLAGYTGVVWWQYGSSNGSWSADWVSGISPAYVTFPKKVSASDANPDRVRWYVKSTLGGCSPTAYSPAILLRNHNNENPTSISSSINNICAGVAGTLTVTFPTATSILGTVEFATSCGGAAFATIAGNGTTTVATAFTAPATTTTYYARYNPGAGSNCSPGSCVSITVNVNPPAPATPGIITGTVAQCPNVTNLPYSIAAVANATSYTWTVPTGWVITAGASTNAITVTSGAFGQNGNITVTASNSCGTSAAALLAVNTNGCLPAPSVMAFPSTANVYITISSGAILMFGNPATNAISNGGSAGGFNRWIISEGQGNSVQWNDITAGTYVVPFGYSNSAYIPFTFTKTSAGSSSLNVSTWGTPSNNLPWATATNVAAVNNMYCSDIPGDGSVASVIDRWWTINTTATADITFSYRGSENTTTYSPTGLFGAQHWNGTSWDAPVGSSAGVTSGVGTVFVPGASTFSPWVLSTKSHPLPVTWLETSAECNHGEVTVKWSTASEQNSNFFTVERSLDGTNFSSIATVPAAGNSSSIKKYYSVDTDPYSLTSYYRIRETDFNGSFMYSNVQIVNGCANDDVSIYSTGNGVAVNIEAEEDGEYALEIYDVFGQKIMSEIKNVAAGSNHIKLYPGNIASAVYIVKVYNSKSSVTKKIFIRKTE